MQLIAGSLAIVAVSMLWWALRLRRQRNEWRHVAEVAAAGLRGAASKVSRAEVLLKSTMPPRPKNWGPAAGAQRGPQD